jgi:hypothetical protein
MVSMVSSRVIIGQRSPLSPRFGADSQIARELCMLLVIAVIVLQRGEEEEEDEIERPV